MADKEPSKWMGALRERMEAKGSVGSLRAVAKKRGLIKGDESLSFSDLNALGKGAGSSLAKKVNAARNMMKASKGG